MIRIPPLAIALALGILGLGVLAACASAGRMEVETPAIRGRVLAARNCSGCHNLNAQGSSPLPGAPPFRILPANPGALARFAGDIRLHHPDGMPAIILSPDQARDVAAYIQTLQSDDPKARLPAVPPCVMRLC